MRRWAIYIDIEGFSEIYSKDEARAAAGLSAIMEGIYRVGTTVCAEAPNRLFVHQTGDGFVIVRDESTDVVKSALKKVVETIKVHYAA